MTSPINTLLISAALLFSSSAIAAPHVAKILGNVTLKVNDAPFNYINANSTLELSEGSIICIVSGDGEVSIDNGAIQLSNPPECAPIQSPNKPGLIASLISKLKQINPMSPQGELSRAHARDPANKKATIVNINKPNTDTIVFSNEAYLVINVEQLLKATSTYPLTLRLYNPARKMTYSSRNTQQGITNFVLPAALLHNKNGYTLKISDSTEAVLMNSTLQIEATQTQK